jgi:hypothetical protein
MISVEDLGVKLTNIVRQQTANQSSRQADQSNQMAQELKTTRLHIDGFMKSKSRAI